MNRACADLVGHAKALDGIPVAGRTDWSILEDVMRLHGMALEPPRFEDLRSRYITIFATRSSGPAPARKR